MSYNLTLLLNFIKRRTLTVISLILYFIVWAFGFSFFHKAYDNPANGCGAANGGLLVLLVLLSGLYISITLVLILACRGQKRKDFLLAFALVLLPILVSIIDVQT